MVCPRCGGPSEVDLFCKKCFLDQNLKIAIPKRLDLARCKRCGKLRERASEWIEDDDIEGFVMRQLSEAIKGNFKEMELATGDQFQREISIKPYRQDEFEAKVEIRLGDFLLEKECTIHVSPIFCGNCERARSGYYTSILQLRGDFDREKVITEIRDMVNSMNDQYSFVTKVERDKKGADVYIGSKKAADKVVRQLAKRAEVKRSNKLLSQDKQTSKTLFRFYYSIRF
jgi:NMD protein affecting ribosome stability and mRNA decay